MSDVVPSTRVSHQDLRAAIGDPSGLPISYDDINVRSLAGVDYVSGGKGTRISALDFRGKGGNVTASDYTVAGARASWSRDGWQYHSFIASGSITVTRGWILAEVMVFGGGGGGGAGRSGGGGGAGAIWKATIGLGVGRRDIYIGAKGIEMPRWEGTTMSSVNATAGGDTVISFTEAIGKGGGVQHDPRDGGCGAGAAHHLPIYPGNGIGVDTDLFKGEWYPSAPSEEKATWRNAGYPGGRCYKPPINQGTTYEGEFRTGGGGGCGSPTVPGKAPDVTATTVGYGGAGTNYDEMLPNWNVPIPSFPRRTGFCGGGAGATGVAAGPTGGKILIPRVDGGGASTPANTGGNAQVYSGAGGASGRFSQNINYQGGNGGSGFVILRFKY